MSRRPATLAAPLLALALLLPGCGDSGEERGEAPAERVTTEKVVVQTSSSGFDAAEVYRRAAPGVVTIRAIFGGGGGEGSGFVLDEDGRLVTNAHVVSNDASGRRQASSQVFVEFGNRNVLPAEILGLDPFADIALLKVEPADFELQPLRLGDDEELVVGQPVAAIGSPFGEQQSLSVGVVSATDRSVRSLTEFQIEGAIQTDASINPGNSGGPLLDAAARVIGVNQQIETETGANDGVGFAVPISTVKRSIEQLEAEGEVEYAYIGVSTQPLYPQLAQRLGIDARFGALISDVVADGPADKAGLRGGDSRIRFQGVPYKTGGDVVLAVDGRKVVRPDDLARLIVGFEPGDEVTLEVLRDDGEREEISVRLGARPDGGSPN